MQREGSRSPRKPVGKPGKVEVVTCRVVKAKVQGEAALRKRERARRRHHRHHQSQH